MMSLIESHGCDTAARQKSDPLSRRDRQEVILCTMDEYPLSDAPKEHSEGATRCS